LSTGALLVRSRESTFLTERGRCDRGRRLLSGSGTRQGAGQRCLPQLELGSLGARRDRTLGLQPDTCENSLVRKVTVLISIHSTNSCFQPVGSYPLT